MFIEKKIGGHRPRRDFDFELICTEKRGESKNRQDLHYFIISHKNVKKILQKSTGPHFDTPDVTTRQSKVWSPTHNTYPFCPSKWSLPTRSVPTKRTPSSPLTQRKVNQQCSWDLKAKSWRIFISTTASKTRRKVEEFLSRHLRVMRTVFKMTTTTSLIFYTSLHTFLLPFCRYFFISTICCVFSTLFTDLSCCLMNRSAMIKQAKQTQQSKAQNLSESERPMVTFRH